VPTEQLFRERGSGLDKVLATVQHDQNLPVLQEFEEFRQRIGRESRKPECTGNGSGHQLRIRDRRQVDNAGTVRIGSAQVVGGSRSNRGFADTPRPDDRHKASKWQTSRQCRDNRFTADRSRRRRRNAVRLFGSASLRFEGDAPGNSRMTGSAPKRPRAPRLLRVAG
jgi:hypothetical protein